MTAAAHEAPMNPQHCSGVSMPAADQEPPMKPPCSGVSMTAAAHEPPMNPHCSGVSMTAAAHEPPMNPHCSGVSMTAAAGGIFWKGGLISHENHSQRTHPSENPSNSRVGARVRARADSAEGSRCAGRDAPLKIRSEFPEFGDGHGEEGPLGNRKNAFATIEGGGACMQVLRQIAPLRGVGLLPRLSANCPLSMRHFTLKRKFRANPPNATHSVAPPCHGGAHHDSLLFICHLVMRRSVWKTSSKSPVLAGGWRGHR